MFHRGDKRGQNWLHSVLSVTLLAAAISLSGTFHEALNRSDPASPCIRSPLSLRARVPRAAVQSRTHPKARSLPQKCSQRGRLKCSYRSSSIYSWREEVAGLVIKATGRGRSDDAEPESVKVHCVIFGLYLRFLY